MGVGSTLNLVLAFQNDLGGRIIKSGGRLESSIHSMVSCRLSKTDPRISGTIIAYPWLLERICTKVLTLFDFDSCYILDIQFLFTPIQFFISCAGVSVWFEKLSFEWLDGWLYSFLFRNFTASFRTLFKRMPFD